MAKKASKKRVKGAKKAVKKMSKKRGRPPGSNKSAQKVEDDFTIDEDFKKLLPPLSDEDKKKLRRSIIKDGCREKLTVWKEERLLLDGHHRYGICKDSNRPYEVVWKSFKSRDEAVKWILNNQRGRRNMNKFQWAEVVLKSKGSFVALAKERLKAKGKEGYQKSDKAVHVLKEMAKLAGMSHDTIHRVETILKEVAANPVNERLQRQVDKLRKGEPGVSINGVYATVQEAKGKRKALAPKQSNPISKVKKAVLREVMTQIKSVLSTLDDVDLDGTQIEEHNMLYDKIIEWANARKTGLEEPSE